MFHSQVDQQATDGERRLGVSLGNGFKIRVRQRPLFRLNDVGLWRYGVSGQPFALVWTFISSLWAPGIMEDCFGETESAQLSRYKLVDHMARRIDQLVLALLPCTAVLAAVPVDPNLKPCGDAYYYPSKVNHISKFYETLLIRSSILVMTPISCVQS